MIALEDIRRQWRDLDFVGPVFRIPSSNVRVLYSCTQFNATLLEFARKAKRRIILSTLYIGTDEVTSKLTSTIAHNASTNEQLQVGVIADLSRSLRMDAHYSKVYEILSSGGRTPPHNINLHLFSASGKDIQVLPGKLQEVYGVHHIKYMLFDDCVILTGANISKTYLSNRHDRYFVLERCPSFCDYLAQCFDTISSFCYSYDPVSASLIPPQPSTSSASDVNSSGAYSSDFLKDLKNALDGLMRDDGTAGVSRTFTSSSSSLDAVGDEDDGSSGDTLICPIFQFGKASALHLEKCLEYIIREHSEHSGDFHITSAYINFVNSFERSFDKATLSGSKLNFILPNPLTNSFHNSGKIMHLISGMYSLFIQNFVSNYGNNPNANIYEYLSNGESYHAKGIWHTPRDSQHPSLTLIGSSNFNRRSQCRDLELNFLFMTHSTELQQSLGLEIENIMKNTSSFDSANLSKVEYQVPFLCYFLQYFVKSYL